MSAVTSAVPSVLLLFVASPSSVWWAFKSARSMALFFVDRWCMSCVLIVLFGGLYIVLTWSGKFLMCTWACNASRCENSGGRGTGVAGTESCTRIATPPPALSCLSLRSMLYWGMFSLLCGLRCVSFSVSMCGSCSCIR